MRRVLVSFEVEDPSSSEAEVENKDGGIYFHEEDDADEGNVQKHTGEGPGPGTSDTGAVVDEGSQDANREKDVTVGIQTKGGWRNVQEWVRFRCVRPRSVKFLAGE